MWHVRESVLLLGACRSSSVLVAAKCDGACDARGRDIKRPSEIVSTSMGHGPRKAEMARAEWDRQRCRFLGSVANLVQKPAVNPFRTALPF